MLRCEIDKSYLFWMSTVWIIAQIISKAKGQNRMSIQMPHVNSSHSDQYFCYTVPISREPIYITGFEPETSKPVHHMLLFACKQPTSSDVISSCDFNPCVGSSPIIYGWAMQASALYLPNEVSLEISGQSDLNYLILQVHYLTDGVQLDTSGVHLVTVSDSTPYKAWVITREAFGTIPPGQEKATLEVGCRYEGDVPLNIFAMRVHAHDLTRTMVGFLLKKSSGEMQEISRLSPQWPQAFYTSNEGMVLEHGDLLVVRCVYDSTSRSVATHIGMSHMDEMCKLYFMYFNRGNNNSVVRDVSCVEIPPGTYWDKFPENSTDHLPLELPSYLIPISENGDNIHLHMQQGENQPMKMDSLSVRVEDSWQVNRPLGQVSGVTMDKNESHILILHRGKRIWNMDTFLANHTIKDKNPITENVVLHVKCESGVVEKQWGNGLFVLPHGIYFDLRGNHVWITDVGSHTVMRFNYDEWSKPSLTLGTFGVPGNDDEHFCQPTDVVTNEEGEIFIADGYCNSRIVKFSSDGKFMKSWGSLQGGFMIVHSITIIDSLNWVCMADGEHAAIECFDFDGKFQRLFTSPEHQSQLLGESVQAIRWNSNKKELLGISVETSSEDTHCGFIFSIDVLAENQENVIKVINSCDNEKGGSMLTDPHGMAISSDGEQIFVALLADRRVVKLIQDNHSEQNVDSLHYMHHMKTDQPREIHQSVHDKSIDVSWYYEIIGFSAVLIIITFCIAAVALSSLQCYDRMKKKKDIESTIIHYMPLSIDDDDEMEHHVAYNSPKHVL